MRFRFRKILKFEIWNCELQVQKNWKQSEKINLPNTINPPSAQIWPSSGENVFPDCASIWVIFSTGGLDLSWGRVNCIGIVYMLRIKIVFSGGPLGNLYVIYRTWIFTSILICSQQIRNNIIFILSFTFPYKRI